MLCVELAPLVDSLDRVSTAAFTFALLAGTAMIIRSIAAFRRKV